MRILVAEDEKNLNRIISEAIADEGYSVDSCFNGIEALEYMACARYDVIVLDIMMPKMDGLQAAKAIRAMQAERPDAEEIPIIALSANAFAEDVQTSLDAGMNGHVSKPLNVAEVAKVIARNLNKS